MSIIVTQINKYGIVFGSDSNITSNTRIEKEGKKIFQIPKLNSAMCIAGIYSVNNKLMDEWLPDFIKNQESRYNSLKDFTKLLSEAFETEMLKEEKEVRSISQVAGYTDGHPEMWCLSNTILLNDGSYSVGEDQFHYSEDLWGRDWEKNHLKELFNSDGLNYQMYVNAITPGRIAFNLMRQFIDVYFKTVWGLSDFAFRCPESISEHEVLVKSYINVMDTTYQLSDYRPKTIGGTPQVYMISNPCNPE